jgi:hypothetical protein
MAEPSSMPSVAECQAFAQKLGQFRATLSAQEQHLLDVMAIAAFRPADEADEQGYEWFYGGPQYVPPTSSPNPYWYIGSGASAWNGTPWGTTIGGIQSAYPLGGGAAYPSGGLP